MGFFLQTWVMKLQLCSFSGYKIHPGHGKTMVRVDGKIFIFLNKKCEASHMMKRNPREVAWTVLYRRKHKKGIEEEAAKKITRRTQKHQRAIVGATLTDIMAKRNMKPEVRKVLREQAIRPSKENKKAAKAQKKATQPAHSKGKSTKTQAQKAPKPIPKSSSPGHGSRR